MLLQKGRPRRPGRRPARAVLLPVAMLLLVALAGCLGGADGDRNDPGAAETIPSEVAFSGCRELLGVWTLSHEDVAPYLPPGFTPNGGGFSSLATGANASMHLLAVSCTQPEEASMLVPWLPVDPPAHLLDAESDLYRIMLPCLGDAAMVEILQTWGVPCTVADARMITETQTPAAATWAFEAESAELSLRLEGHGVATGDLAFEPTFGQFHVTERQVCAFSHLRLQDHIHWEGDGFTLEVEGEAPFPTPAEPGAGLLALPDLWMNIRPIAKAETAPAGTSPCPEGEMPPGTGQLPTAEEAANRSLPELLPDGTPVPASMDFTGCSEQGGLFAVPLSQAPDLPEGFSYVPSDPAGTTATQEWITRSCSLDGGEPYAEQWAFFHVQPPEHLASQDAGLHLLALFSLTSLDHPAEVYEAWGAHDPVWPGNITVEVLQETPATRTGKAAGDLGGGAVAEIYTNMRGQPTTEPSRAARVFGFGAHGATGAMDVRWTGAEHALFEGEATFYFDAPVTSFAPPPEPGLGFHLWGESYDLTVERVELPR